MLTAAPMPPLAPVTSATRPEKYESTMASQAIHGHHPTGTLRPGHVRHQRPKVEPVTLALVRYATFDCYGTLIDWNAGIRSELARLFGEDDTDGLLKRYHELEPQVQSEDPAKSYREVMAEVLKLLAKEQKRRLKKDDRDALGRSLPEWRPFPEVPQA